MLDQCLDATNSTQPIGRTYSRIPCRPDARFINLHNASSQASGFVA